MRAVDTNVLVRIVIRDDPQQAGTADGFIRPGAWVSLVALTEAAWVLRGAYGFDSAKLASAIEMLLDHRELVFQDADALAEALELFRHRPALGFTDCLILALARNTGHLPLGTFDRALAKAEGARQL